MEKIREMISKKKPLKLNKTEKFAKKKDGRLQLGHNNNKNKNNLTPDLIMELFENHDMEKVHKVIDILDEKKKIAEKNVVLRPCPPSLLQENLELSANYYFEKYGEDVIYMYNNRNTIWKDFEYVKFLKNFLFDWI